jgi:hypothetical protein
MSLSREHAGPRLEHPLILLSKWESFELSSAQELQTVAWMIRQVHNLNSRLIDWHLAEFCVQPAAGLARVASHSAP